MKKILCTLLALQIFILNLEMSSARAQSESGEEDLLKKTQEDIVLVAASGVVGAVLGLSTLSFVETPSQHIYNIWTGAALGVIAGVVYVAYNSAQRGSEDLQSATEFNTRERLAWHRENTIQIPLGPPLSAQIFQFTF